MTNTPSRPRRRIDPSDNRPISRSTDRPARRLIRRSRLQSRRWVLTMFLGLAVVLGGCGQSGSPTKHSAVVAKGEPVSVRSAKPDGSNGHAERSGGLTPGMTSGSGVATTGVEDPGALPAGVEPVRIEIPAIGVEAPVIGLDLRGPEPEVPTDFDDAGWYQQTRRPGEIGPAVIAGHIDSKEGPAVFARLDQLAPGDRIVVHGARGDQQTFVVTGHGQYGKELLPPEVFNFDQPVPELRLITCGGLFDRSTGHYRDNYVVYAELDQSAA